MPSVAFCRQEQLRLAIVRGSFCGAVCSKPTQRCWRQPCTALVVYSRQAATHCGWVSQHKEPALLFGDWILWRVRLPAESSSTSMRAVRL